jgi:hypothetical protein
LERALVSSIEPGLVGLLGYDSLRIPRLRGWAVDAHHDQQIRPNSKAWEHLDDLEALPGQLRAALGD